MLIVRGILLGFSNYLPQVFRGSVLMGHNWQNSENLTTRPLNQPGKAVMQSEENRKAR